MPSNLLGARTDIVARRGGGDYTASWFTTNNPREGDVIGAFRATLGSEDGAARVAAVARKTFPTVAVDGRTVHATFREGVYDYRCKRATWNPNLRAALTQAGGDCLLLSAVLSNTWFFELNQDQDDLRPPPRTVEMPSFEDARMVTGDATITMNNQTIKWSREDLNALGVSRVPTWYDSQRYEQFAWEE